jgi:hypothetical protein
VGGPDPERPFLIFPYDYPIEPGFIFTFGDTEGVTIKDHEYRTLYNVWADPIADKLYGFSVKGETLLVTSWKLPDREITVTNEDGSWESDYSEWDIPLDMFFFVDILDDDGDATRRVAVTGFPHITINLTNQQIMLRDFPELSPVDVTITDNASTVIYSDTVSIGPANWGYDPLTEETLNYGDIDVLPGYTITATDGNTTKVLIVSELTLDNVDPLADTVSGTAAPDSEVWINVYDMGSRQEFANGDGDWFADLSVYGDEDWEDPLDIMYENGGDVSQVDDDMDRTMLSWWVSLPVCPAGTDIAGTVYDADGTTPLDGAVVHFRDVSSPSEDFCTVTVGADGTYSVELPDGTYKLFAEGAGYSRQYYQATINENAAQLTVSDSNQHSGIDFALDMPIVIYEHFVFNLNDPVLSDLAVRQAIAYGTDRQRMIDETYVHAPVWDSYLAFYQWAYNPDVATYAYDPLTAAQVLDDAGWTVGTGGIREKDGQPLSFSYVGPITPQREKIRDIFIENMTARGIRRAGFRCG